MLIKTFVFTPVSEVSEKLHITMLHTLTIQRTKQLHCIKRIENCKQRSKQRSLKTHFPFFPDRAIYQILLQPKMLNSAENRIMNPNHEGEPTSVLRLEATPTGTGGPDFQFEHVGQN